MNSTSKPLTATQTPPTRRSLLLSGLRIALSRPRAVLWTYIFNLGFALIFSLRGYNQFNDILAHSLAAQRLTSAFDLGVLVDLNLRMNHAAPSTGSSNYLGLLCYTVVYFLLVPGTLFCYQTEAPARLAILLSTGMQRFWRFLRIAVLNLIVSGLILGPLLALASAWSNHVSDTWIGRPAFLAELAGYLAVGLVACVLRLYFDLVEVYTMFLGDQLRPDGRPDRRVRRVLLPALRTLGRNLFRAAGTFILLTALGLLAVSLTFSTAMHMLAQPRVWPMFLLAQLGLLCLLFTRFWQRGAEMALAFDFPLPMPAHLRQEPPVFQHHIATEPPPAAGTVSAFRPQPPVVTEVMSNPEPAAPSRSAPNPGVFRHVVPDEFENTSPK